MPSSLSPTTKACHGVLSGELAVCPLPEGTEQTSSSLLTACCNSTEYSSSCKQKTPVSLGLFFFFFPIKIRSWDMLCFFLYSLGFL